RGGPPGGSLGRPLPAGAGRRGRARAGDGLDAFSDRWSGHQRWRAVSLVRSALYAGAKGANAAAKGVAGAAAWGQMAIDDFLHIRRALDGNDIDAWDPEYIRRVLPGWRALMATYFRGEVRGLDNIPEEGPSLLVGNHSGGTMI